MTGGGTAAGPVDRAIAAIARRLAPAEYAFVSNLTPEECLARVRARVPPRARTALLPWGGGLALPGGGRVFLETGPRWFRLSQAHRAGGFSVGPGGVGAGYSADWMVQLEAVLTPGPEGTRLEVAVGCGDEDAANATGVVGVAIAAVAALMALGSPAAAFVAPAVAVGFLAVAALIWWQRRATPSAAAQAPLLDLLRETLDLRPASQAGAADGPPRGRPRRPRIAA